MGCREGTLVKTLPRCGFSAVKFAAIPRGFARDGAAFRGVQAGAAAADDEKHAEQENDGFNHGAITEAGVGCGYEKILGLFRAIVADALPGFFECCTAKLQTGFPISQGFAAFGSVAFTGNVSKIGIEGKGV